MVEIGRLNKLRVIKILYAAAYLDAENFGKILFPKQDLPKQCKIGDMIEVFIYPDAEGIINATIKKPYAMLNTFALLKVISVNSKGAFLAWGMKKNLFAPKSAQQQKMEIGKSYIVFVCLDDDRKRITASSRLEEFLDKKEHDFQEGQEVELLICAKTEIGYTAIANNSHWGLIYANEVFQTLTKGEHVTGFIKKMREDKKLDFTLQRPGPKKVDDLSLIILDSLKKHDGFIPLTDKSDAQMIYNFFGVSKKTYKKALGFLYKKRLIVIEDNGIKLVL